MRERAAVQVQIHTLTGSPFTVAPSVSPIQIAKLQNRNFHLRSMDGYVHPPKENTGTRRPLEPSLRKGICFGSNATG